MDRNPIVAVMCLGVGSFPNYELGSNLKVSADECFPIRLLEAEASNFLNSAAVKELCAFVGVFDEFDEKETDLLFFWIVDKLNRTSHKKLRALSAGRETILIIPRDGRKKDWTREDCILDCTYKLGAGFSIHTYVPRTISYVHRKSS